MKIRAIFIVSLGLMAAILCGFLYLFAITPTQHSYDQKLTLISPLGDRVTIGVEIADATAERQFGLMHRSTLPDGAGMLFVFEDDAPRSFWMKNTLLPLDIFFFDGQGAFVSKTTMVPCENQDPCPGYPSKGPARYALEVKAGEEATQSVDDGWTIEIQEY